MELGYWLASEEHGPKALVESAVVAERAGFEHEEQTEFIEFARQFM